MMEHLHALLLGLIEGLTEFLPVSSTGHLIIAGDLLGFKGPPGHVFEVAIQLGAILAVLVVYFRRIAYLLFHPVERESIEFIRNILLAFFPAALLGAALHGFIKTVLFSPYVVSVALIAGGIVILVVERRLPRVTSRTMEQVTTKQAFAVGLFQCLALIPGVSRSGATILGAVLMGVERRVAAEFSFFLAIPTMLGAVAYDLYKNRDALAFDDAALIATGFAAAFLTALIVVRAAVALVSRYGFTPFGWYRIAAGAGMLLLLSL